LSRYLLIRLALFGTLTVLCALAVTDGMFFLAGLLGIGAVFTGVQLLDRKGTKRSELRRWARENERELTRVEMQRLVALQEGLLESLELVSEEYGPLLDEDIFAIIGEVDGAARLARRRAALRLHLESVDWREISHRIESLEQDISELEESSPLRAPLESALEGRRGELALWKDILDGISIINVQLEDAESLLSNLRGELLAIDASLSPGSLEPGLAHLKSRVAYFRQSMDEVTRSMEALPAGTKGRLPAG